MKKTSHFLDLFNAVKCQKTESVKVFMTHIISKESNEEHSTINLLMEAIQFFGFPMLLLVTVSVRRLVGWLVGLSVGNAFAFSVFFEQFSHHCPCPIARD